MEGACQYRESNVTYTLYILGEEFRTVFLVIGEMG